MTLDLATADRLAGIARGHVTRLYPHALSHVLDGDEDARTPRALHPAFHGSFDWHSCVHGHWLMATALRRFPGIAWIPAQLDQRLTADRIDGELAYFRRPGSRGFQRPYGWAWLLALHHALRGTRWAEAVAPLAAEIAGRLAGFLPQSRYPVRVGTHFNTAFALTMAAPWAAANDPRLATLLRDKAWAWYGEDRACQAWEPGQDDFLSSALIEAVCIARLVPDRFPAWFAAFLPELEAGRPATLFHPAAVDDRTDGKIAHLDGLNLSRAWCWRVLSAAVPGGTALAAAERHLGAGLGHVEGDFMGEHWLASFALLALWPDAAL